MQIIRISEQRLADNLKISPLKVREICGRAKVDKGKYNFEEAVQLYAESVTTGSKEIVTQKRLAEIIGVGDRTVRNLVDSNVLSRNENEDFDLIANIKAYIEYQRANNESQRLKKIQADRLELKYEVENGTVESLDVIEHYISTMIMNFRQKILGIPNKLSKDLTEKMERPVVEKILKDELFKVLEELSEYENFNTKTNEKNTELIETSA